MVECGLLKEIDVEQQEYWYVKNIASAKYLEQLELKSSTVAKVQSTSAQAAGNKNETKELEVDEEKKDEGQRQQVEQVDDQVKMKELASKIVEAQGKLALA